ncbi:integrase [Clostridia bacterium]|nr:integrase [Clostridia bacterium]
MRFSPSQSRLSLNFVMIDDLIQKLNFEGADAYLILGADNRYYFSRKSVSSGAVVLTKNSRTYITDSRYETYLKEDPAGFEIVVAKRSEFYNAIAAELQKTSAKTVAFEDDELTVAQFDALKEAIPTVEFVQGSSAINALRAVKSEEEFGLIAEAQRITAQAYEAGLDVLKHGVIEREVAAEIVYEMIRAGADEAAFNPIVSFGAEAAKPHHAPGDTRLEKGMCVMIDIGAKFQGYCADMTRTVFYGEPDPALVKIYGVVKEAQANILRYIRAGMSCHEADSLAREYIKAEGYGAYFGHGSGHGVGVKIHEEPSLSPNTQTVLQKDMVVTVEPGIYVPEFGGVRIEDMARITDGECVNLTNVRKDLQIVK